MFGMQLWYRNSTPKLTISRNTSVWSRWSRKACCALPRNCTRQVRQISSRKLSSGFSELIEKDANAHATIENGSQQCYAALSVTTMFLRANNQQVIEYITLQLVQGYGSDNFTTALLDSYDFYILPFVNPDGEFTLSAKHSSMLTVIQVLSIPKRSNVSGARTACHLHLPQPTRAALDSMSTVTGTKRGMATHWALPQTHAVKL